MIVFFPLYSLASFVKDKVFIGAWVYLWAFYFVPLIYISVFMPVPYSIVLKKLKKKKNNFTSDIAIGTITVRRK